MHEERDNHEFFSFEFIRVLRGEKEKKSMSHQGSEKYEDSNLYRIRHSAAHIMAQAVLEVFPAGKITIGVLVDRDLPIYTEEYRRIRAKARAALPENLEP